MSLEKFQWCRGRHLRGYHALEIVLERQYIEGPDFIGLPMEFQDAAKGLAFSLLPMEVDPYADILQAEEGIFFLRNMPADYL